MNKLEIVQIPVLADNYVYLAHDPATGSTAVVDPAVTGPVLGELDRRGWALSHIFNTHHHFDHVGGNLELKEKTGAVIYGPEADKDRIPGIDQTFADGDECFLGEARAHVFDVPGHTRGHIAYWFGDSAALFCGDTLFAMGCGRLFEGTPAQMWTSLQKLKALPDETRAYCAHEYTEANGNFALSIEPGNLVLQEHMAEVRALRAKGAPTVPSTIGVEKQVNPFFRPDSAEIQASVGLGGFDLVEVFAAVRKRKDNF